MTSIILGARKHDIRSGAILAQIRVFPDEERATGHFVKDLEHASFEFRVDPESISEIQKLVLSLPKCEHKSGSAEHVVAFLITEITEATSKSSYYCIPSSERQRPEYRKLTEWVDHMFAKGQANLDPSLSEELAKHLDVLCSGLNGGDALNYVANLRLYPCHGLAGSDPQRIVASGLGPDAVLSRTMDAGADEVIGELKRGLEYAGDDGAHPSKDYLGSDSFRREKQETVALLQGLLSISQKITAISLSSGHPFYPVFWELGYIIESGKDAFILIGSSSD